MNPLNNNNNKNHCISVLSCGSLIKRLQFILLILHISHHYITFCECQRKIYSRGANNVRKLSHNDNIITSTTSTSNDVVQVVSSVVGINNDTSKTSTSKTGKTTKNTAVNEASNDVVFTVIAYPSQYPSISPITLPSIDPTNYPSSNPSFVPTSKPSMLPTSEPTGVPSSKPSMIPITSIQSIIPLSSNDLLQVPTLYPSSSVPTSSKPSSIPTTKPYIDPTSFPSTSIPIVQTPVFLTPVTTPNPTKLPTTSTTTNITYIPGLLNKYENGLLLSQGLKSKILAVSGYPVPYYNNNGILQSQSIDKFMIQPDAAAIFPDIRIGNVGGWIYTINSEYRPPKDIPFDINNPNSTLKKDGGVSSITFNSLGEIIDYKIILNNTIANCGGGKTPWGSWISCEEHPYGQIWQVDPTGIKPNQLITMGMNDPGEYESFAYDIRNKQYPGFYVTKDKINGELSKFTPFNPDWNDPWNILYGNGTLEYLLVYPSSEFNGTYSWTTNIIEGKINANVFFPNSEGIDIYDNQLYFVSKKNRKLFILNLDNNTYTVSSTKSGLFQGEADQIVRLVSNTDTTTTATTTQSIDNTILYFTEDGNKPSGIHGRNINDEYFTILESDVYADETTGLAFSPDSMHMYIVYQDNGVLFDITREDGLPFSGKTLNVKYHNNITNTP